LRKFFQAGPEFLIGRDPLLTVLLLGWSLEEELQDVALGQTTHQIVKGAVFVSLGTGTIGFATGGETFDVGSAQEMRGHGQSAQERGFALAQGQGGSAAQLEYLSQVLG